LGGGEEEPAAVIIMNPTRIVVQGRLRPDGTLELHQSLGLPPGPVQVTVQQVASAESPREDTWIVLERIWAERKALGLKSRSKEEIDTEINAMRDESEDRMMEIEQIHQDARGPEEEPPC